MYLFIAEDGEAILFDRIEEEDLEACRDGLCDLIFIEGGDDVSQYDPISDQWVIMEVRKRASVGESS